MDRGRVQRIVTVRDAEKAGRLGKGGLAKTLDEMQLHPALEPAVRLAVGHDIAGHRRLEARDVLEQSGRSGVEIHADIIHAGLHHVAEGLAQLPLVHVVLVLAHADRFGVDLDQLGQGIEEPPGDGNRSAHGDVEIRKFLPGQRGSGIDRGARFADDGVGQPPAVGADQLGHEGLRLAGGRAVADGDQVDPVLRDEPRQDGQGLFLPVLRGMRVDRGGRQELAGLVDQRRLAAGPETRVDAQHPVVPHGRLEQEMAQVDGEDLDGLHLGPRGEFRPDLTDQRGPEQTVVAVGDGLRKDAR